MGLEEEIEDLREEIADTPYNKSTEAHIGRLKAKLAEKKEKLENQSSAGGGHGYAVEKHGDATVALVGFPSVGKSTLINALTNADSEVGSYEFTTLDVNPGMLKYRGANIQILDVPGLIEGAAGGRGGGKEVLSVVRTADLVVFMLSVFEIEQYDRLREELYATNIRLDTEPPNINIRKTHKDGLGVTMSDDVSLDEETIKQVLREYGYVNAKVTIPHDLTIDELVDAVMNNREYLPSMVSVNKADLIDKSYLPTVKEELRERDLDPEDVIFISAEEGLGLTLAVSLHAPNDALRSEIVPINKKYPIAMLLESVQGYMNSLNDKRVPVIEYTLIAGVNDHRQHARELAVLLKDFPCKINIIPFNPFELSDYRRPSSTSITNFRQILQQAGTSVLAQANQTTQGVLSLLR